MSTKTFDFSGGALCLDFANTVSGRPDAGTERLREFSDLLRWAGEAGVVDPEANERLARQAESDPRGARRTLAAAVALREALYRIFSALAAGGRPPPADVDLLNGALSRCLAFLEVQPRGKGFAWVWSPEPERFDRVLWPVARSAAEFMTSAEAGLVRECASEHCSWLFVDRSRTRRRRWCDMRICGNRAKARRHYHRRRQRSPPGDGPDRGRA
jgi:predicted RNA-binding Zn ribbon-like protein